MLSLPRRGKKLNELASALGEEGLAVAEVSERLMEDWTRSPELAEAGRLMSFVLRYHVAALNRRAEKLGREASGDEDAS